MSPQWVDFVSNNIAEPATQNFWQRPIKEVGNKWNKQYQQLIGNYNCDYQNFTLTEYTYYMMGRFRKADFTMKDSFSCFWKHS